MRRTLYKIFGTALLMACLRATPGMCDDMIISWGASMGFTVCDEWARILDSSQSIRMQLIYSYDNAINPNYGFETTDDDVLLDEIVMEPQDAGSSFGDFVARTNYTGAYLAGYVYGRVFSRSVYSAYILDYVGPLQETKPYTLPADLMTYDLNTSLLTNDIVAGRSGCMSCPDPCPQPITQSLSTNGEIMISFTPIDLNPNAYQLQFTTNLPDGVWYDLGIPLAGGTLIDSNATDTMRYYRTLKILTNWSPY